MIAARPTPKTKSTPLPQRLAKSTKETFVQAARAYSGAFSAYAMRDELGRPFKMADIHLEWHQLLAQHSRLIIWGSAELGKSLQLVAYAAWRIGCDPTTRVVIASKTKEKAAQLLSALVNVMMSPQYKELFPDTVILRANAHTMHVLGWDGKNPTVQAYQFKAPIMGNRVDLLILDDILDRLNTRTEEMREEQFQFYKDTYISRLTARGQVVFISNAWHPRDLMHRLKAEKMWVTRKYPIWRAGAGGQMESIWPEQWPLKRILERREEYGNELVLWRRNYECEAVDDVSVTWQQTWIDKAEALGRGLRLVSSIDQQDEVFRAITIGIDLSSARPHTRNKTDENAFVVVGKRMDGRKRLLWIESGKWFGPELVARVRSLYMRFRPCIPWVETNGAQKIVKDFVTAPAAYGSPFEPYPDPEPIPAQSFETSNKKKFDERFGVEALGIEMDSGIWVFPSEGHTHDYNRLKGEMMSYDANAHVGDRLMATWFASEGLRLGSRGAHVVPGYSAAAR